jgi:hypothetical protein
LSELEAVFRDLRELSDTILRLEVAEGEKFYWMYKDEFSHHVFIAYVAAFTAKVRQSA